MLTYAERTSPTLLDWDPGEETVVPNCHNVAVHSFEWDTDEDTVVPGHHEAVADAFTWN
jgi:hypothetical protein